MSSEVEERIFEELKSISQKLGVNNDRFDTLENRFDTLENRFDTLEQRFDNLEQRFDNLEQRFDNLEQRFDNLEQRFDNLEQRMDKKFDEIDHRLDVLTRSVVLIENRITTEIPTLFDAYTSQHDKQTMHQNDINSLNRKVEDHDIRISILEQNTV